MSYLNSKIYLPTLLMVMTFQIPLYPNFYIINNFLHTISLSNTLSSQRQHTIKKINIYLNITLNNDSPFNVVPCILLAFLLLIISITYYAFIFLHSVLYFAYSSPYFPSFFLFYILFNIPYSHYLLL